MGWLIDATIDNYRKEIIERMKLLRHDPNMAGHILNYNYVDCANDMLDACIAIVKEVCSST